MAAAIHLKTLSLGNSLCNAKWNCKILISNKNQPKLKYKIMDYSYTGLLGFSAILVCESTSPWALSQQSNI